MSGAHRADARHRAPFLAILASLVLAALVAVAVAACGATAPRAHARAATLVSGVVEVTAVDCANALTLPAAVQPGTQVTVLAPSGTVLGTAALGAAVSAGPPSYGMSTCALPFTLTGVPVQRLYGIRLAGVSGTTWSRTAGAITVTVGQQP